MSDKIKRIRCGTKQCAGFIDVQLSTTRAVGNNWQFHCARCGFWILVSTDGAIRGTSREQYDLHRVASQLGPMRVTRSPEGGV